MACGHTIHQIYLRLSLFPRRYRRAAVGLALGAIAATASCSAMADPIKATLAAKATDGYARLIFTMSEYDDATVRLSDNVLIISFKKPIIVSVDRLAEQASGYIGGARRDPDGSAVRIALAQKVTVNSIPAAEKLFVDLLPDSWTGPPPSLPQDVVEDLARRAREAERLLRHEHMEAQQTKLVPVPVHVAVQPTFTRYVFKVPDQTSVSADRAKDRLTLTFDTPIKFDVGDAEAALPSAVEDIKTEMEEDSTLVRFTFAGKVDVRTFREDNSYVVDVVGSTAKSAEGGAAPAKAAEGGPPETMPPNKPAKEAASTAPDAMAPLGEKPNIEAPATIAAVAPKAMPGSPPAQPQPTSPSMPMAQPGAPSAAPTAPMTARCRHKPPIPGRLQLRQPRRRVLWPLRRAAQHPCPRKATGGRSRTGADRRSSARRSGRGSRKSVGKCSAGARRAIGTGTRRGRPRQTGSRKSGGRRSGGRREDDFGKP